MFEHPYAVHRVIDISATPTRQAVSTDSEMTDMAPLPAVAGHRVVPQLQLPPLSVSWSSVIQVDLLECWLAPREFFCTAVGALVKPDLRGEGRAPS